MPVEGIAFWGFFVIFFTWTAYGGILFQGMDATWNQVPSRALVGMPSTLISQKLNADRPLKRPFAGSPCSSIVSAPKADMSVPSVFVSRFLHENTACNHPGGNLSVPIGWVCVARPVRPARAQEHVHKDHGSPSEGVGSRLCPFFVEELDSTGLGVIFEPPKRHLRDPWGPQTFIFPGEAMLEKGTEQNAGVPSRGLDVVALALVFVFGVTLWVVVKGDPTGKPTL